MTDIHLRPIPSFGNLASYRCPIGLGTASLAAVALMIGLAPAVVGAEETAAPAALPSVDTQPKKVRVIGPDGKPESVPVVPMSDVERYCTAIADPAKDARLAIQTKRLQDLEAEVNQKIDALEAKRKEYQDWLAQRQAFLDSTSGIMVDIYAAMKPDAAAMQLAGLDREVAASVLTKLKSRTASAILSEMAPVVAAELASLIVKKTNKNLDAAASEPKEGAKS